MPFYVHTLAKMFKPSGTTTIKRVEYREDVFLQTEVREYKVRSVSKPCLAGTFWAAWEVLCGRAFAVRWPEPGELEDAIGEKLERIRPAKRGKDSDSQAVPRLSTLKENSNEK